MKNEFNLIKFDGKPIEKLIEVVSAWIWTKYHPRKIKEEADAKAYEIKTLSHAKSEAILIEWDANIELVKRAQLRLGYQEIKGQKNIEDIAEKSLSYLPESVSKEAIDEDWRTRFFKKAQDISSEKMQEIWAKILAEEVANPWNLSLRTLDILSNISSNEAKLFWILVTLATSNSYIIKIDRYNFSDYGLEFSHLTLLEHAGLISLLDMNRKRWKKYLNSNWKIPISIWKDTYLLSNNNKELKLPISFDTLEFTPAWIELCSSLKSNINEDYYLKTISFIEGKWYNLEKVK